MKKTLNIENSIIFYEWHEKDIEIAAGDQHYRHIEKCLSEGYTAGELCDEKSRGGWWKEINRVLIVNSGELAPMEKIHRLFEEIKLLYKSINTGRREWVNHHFNAPCDFSSLIAWCIQNCEKILDDEVAEYCPHCQTEVSIKGVFRLQVCPECHNPIAPCSLCDPWKDCTGNCPLDTAG